VKLAGLFDSAIVSRLLSYNRSTGHVDKLAFRDLLSVEGLTQLLITLTKRHDIVPGGLAAFLRVDRKREASRRTILTGSKPRVTAETATQHDLGYSLARLWSGGVLSCDGF
jgi:hypothetical protein